MFDRGHDAVIERMLSHDDPELEGAQSSEAVAVKDYEPFVAKNDSGTPCQLGNGQWLMPGQAMVVKVFPEGTSNKDMARWVKSKEQPAATTKPSRNDRVRKVGHWLILGFVVPLGISGTLNGQDYNPVDYVNNVTTGVHDLSSAGEHVMDFAKFMGGLMP